MAAPDWDMLARFALHLAREGGRCVLPHFRRPGIRVEAKAEGTVAEGGLDPVTEADRLGEARMRALIRERFPEHGIAGEEHGTESGNAWTWVLDPIDGTRAFVCGLPTWTVLVALMHEGRPRIGVIHQPYLDETFIGLPGSAWMEVRGQRSPLATRPAATLREARVGTTLPDIYTSARQRRLLEGLRQRVREMRYDADAYFYAMVAAGFMDMALDTEMALYDTAALVPVVEGAGGVITDWDGRSPPAGGDVIAAASPQLLNEALALLAEV